MKLKAQAVSVLFVAAVCSGCIPYHGIMRPGVVGSVVDARTGRPVSAARVTVDTAHDPLLRTRSSFVKASVESDSNGEFLIPPQRKWILWLTWAPIEPSNFQLDVQHEGYQSFDCKFLCGDVDASAFRSFPQIRLEPLPK
jgi:hypothetical protein